MFNVYIYNKNVIALLHVYLQKPAMLLCFMFIYSINVIAYVQCLYLQYKCDCILMYIYTKTCNAALVEVVPVLGSPAPININDSAILISLKS